MRGHESKQTSMLSIVSPEQRVRADHPLRKVKQLADEALARLSPTFDAMYSGMGRPSIPPERLLKSSLLICFYSIRSERLFCEELEYNLLYRWFLDMSMTEEGFDASSFSRNRERLLQHDVAKLFFVEIVEAARKAKLLSHEHFTVDGTLIEAWASLKSLKPKDGSKKNEPPDDPGNPTVNWHGEKRSNETHESSTDPEAKLARKGNSREAKLSYGAHALMENRNGLLVDFAVEPAQGVTEREAALAMLNETLVTKERATVGADKGYDTRNFVDGCRELGVTPHVAQDINTRRGSMIDDRTTRHEGYVISQKVRKRVEEIFGWMKTVGGFRKTRYRGLERTRMAGMMVAAAYNLMRMARMMTNAA
ncbi:MAG: IS5 family transposase [Deltaproteobacteria bacterium]|nr:IS5 family transposase [Deltaproteobacteria bacterium]